MVCLADFLNLLFFIVVIVENPVSTLIITTLTTEKTLISLFALTTLNNLSASPGGA